MVELGREFPQELRLVYVQLNQICTHTKGCRVWKYHTLMDIYSGTPQSQFCCKVSAVSRATYTQQSTATQILFFPLHHVTHIWLFHHSPNAPIPIFSPQKKIWSTSLCGTKSIAFKASAIWTVTLRLIRLRQWREICVIILHQKTANRM